MNRRCCTVGVAAVLLLMSSTAAAQEKVISLAAAEPRLWDVSGDAGWFSSNKSAIAPDWNDWYDAPAGSVAIGRYLTPHLRTEFRVSFTGEGTTYQEEQLPFVPGQPFPSYRLTEHRFRTASAGAGVFHQFFENQWFHPFVGAGLDVERESRRTTLPPQRFVPAGTTEESVSYAARPFVATGFKWYVNERGFFRTDVKVSFGSGGVAHTAWSAGIGADL
jgi:hypothetical protein